MAPGSRAAKGVTRPARQNAPFSRASCLWTGPRKRGRPVERFSCPGSGVSRLGLRNRNAFPYHEPGFPKTSQHGRTSRPCARGRPARAAAERSRSRRAMGASPHPTQAARNADKINAHPGLPREVIFGPRLPLAGRRSAMSRPADGPHRPPAVRSRPAPCISRCRSRPQAAPRSAPSPRPSRGAASPTGRRATGMAARDSWNGTRPGAASTRRRGYRGSAWQRLHRIGRDRGRNAYRLIMAAH